MKKKKKRQKLREEEERKRIKEGRDKKVEGKENEEGRLAQMTSTRTLILSNGSISIEK